MNMTSLSAFLLALILASCMLIAQGSLSEDLILYTEIEPVDTAGSLRRIKELPIVYYKFLYDSVPDRIQLGVVGPEAQRLFPESIEVLPSTAFAQSNQDQSGFSSATLTNLPVVDKSVLFMHGVAAIKELIWVYEKLNASIHSLGEIDKETEHKYEALRSNLHRDLSRLQAEKLQLAQEELSLAKKQLEAETLRASQDEARLAIQLDNERQLLQLEEQLSRERLARQSQLSHDALEKQLQLERELAHSKEEFLRNSAQSLQTFKNSQLQALEQKRLELEKEKIQSEINAKLQQDRLQEEVAIRKLEMQSKLDTERMVQGIKSISSQLTTLAQDIFSRPKQVALVALLILLVLAAYYLLRECTSLLREIIQQRLGKPSLVRETSSSLQWSVLGLPSWLTSRRDKADEQLQSLENQFADIILSSQDKERVVHLAYATRNTRQSGAPFRHILLHGPPGTGKTLIARRLALSSGMDYAILSGGDVAPLGEEAVNQLHALFQWANRSPKGLLLFIDEAEAFLSSRSITLGGNGGGGGGGGGSSGVGGSSEAHLRNALNALLYQTGSPSRQFMMVLATNRPEDLDSAVLDRIDVSLSIGLPAFTQRAEMIDYYLRLHLLAYTQSRPSALLSWETARRWVGQGAPVCTVETACTTSEAIQVLASRTEGFSGREIAKLFISLQYTMYLARQRLLTWDEMQRVVQEKVLEHQMKATGFQSTLPLLLPGRGMAAVGGAVPSSPAAKSTTSEAASSIAVSVKERGRRSTRSARGSGQ